MEKHIYIYPLLAKASHANGECFWEMLDDEGYFMSSGAYPGSSVTVARELRNRESRKGDKVFVYVGKVDFDRWTDEEIDEN